MSKSAQSPVLLESREAQAGVQIIRESLVVHLILGAPSNKCQADVSDLDDNVLFRSPAST